MVRMWTKERVRAAAGEYWDLNWLGGGPEEKSKEEIYGFSGRRHEESCVREALAGDGDQMYFISLFVFFFPSSTFRILLPLMRFSLSSSQQLHCNRVGRVGPVQRHLRPGDEAARAHGEDAPYWRLIMQGRGDRGGEVHDARVPWVAEQPRISHLASEPGVNDRSDADWLICSSSRLRRWPLSPLRLCVSRYHPVHAVALVRLERVQRDVWPRCPNATEDAEVGSCWVRGGAGADREVHVAWVS